MTAHRKLLIYKFLLLAFAFFIAFMPSTAMRNREVNSRVVVELLGLDGNENKIELTAQYVMPAGDGTTDKDTVTVTGDTVNLAVDALGTALGRRAELGHCSVIVIGKDFDTKLLGTLMTVTDVTADVWLSAAEDKAKDSVRDITEFMKKTGATDADFIAYSARKEHIATNTLLGFLSDLNGASKTGYIPLVEVKKSDDGEAGKASASSTGGSEQSSGGKSSGGAGEKTGMKAERLAVYGENGRLGIMDSKAARGVAWVSAPIEKGTICADVEYDGKRLSGVCGRLLKKSASISANAKTGSATIEILAYIEPHGDKFNSLYASNDISARAALVDGYKKEIESDIMSAYSAAIAMNADPLFIGREFFRHAPDYFDNAYSYKDIAVGCDIRIALK